MKLSANKTQSQPPNGHNEPESDKYICVNPSVEGSGGERKTLPAGPGRCTLLGVALPNLFRGITSTFD
jgi:hypothetical protein